MTNKQMTKVVQLLSLLNERGIISWNEYIRYIIETDTIKIREFLHGVMAEIMIFDMNNKE